MATSTNLVVTIRAVVPEETRRAIWRIDFWFYRFELRRQRSPGLPTLRITM